MNRTREQWAVIDAKFCATQNSATANWHLIQDAQKDIAELHRERDALLSERDRLKEALIYARKEAVYGLNHAKTHLQACAALGRISGGTAHALQGAQP